MTEEQTSEQTAQDKMVSDLKAEFAKQFDEFKQQVQKDMEAKDQKIADQEKQIASLTSDLVRSAKVAPAPEEHVKTQEELYQEEVDKYVAKTTEYIKNNFPL